MGKMKAQAANFAGVYGCKSCKQRFASLVPKYQHPHGGFRGDSSIYVSGYHQAADNMIAQCRLGAVDSTK
jgi:hypothetical protein